MELNKDMLEAEFNSLLHIAKFTDNDFITSPFRKEYIEYALSLIKELTKERDGLNVLLDCYVAEQAKLTAEIERLRAENEHKYVQENKGVVETCICCGTAIPEGRQICPQCENEGEAK